MGYTTRNTTTEILSFAQNDERKICGSDGRFDLADDGEDGFDGGGGGDSVAEVEDVSGTAGGGGEDLGDAGVEDVGRGEESDGVEVALDGYAVA